MVVQMVQENQPRLKHSLFFYCDEDLYKFVIKISNGEIKFETIVDWLKNNTNNLIGPLISKQTALNDVLHVYNVAIPIRQNLIRQKPGALFLTGYYC